jgi:prepilin signal peptidase PulO-like enzyme (type II secretory pathway)
MDAVGVALTTYLFLVGLLLGSFINLAADRLPRGESLLRPRSHCRSCGRVLNTLDLVPVLGYLVRRGRCAGCGVSIGAQAPLVEALSGAAMLVPLLRFGLWPGILASALTTAALGAAVIAVNWYRVKRA